MDKVITNNALLCTVALSSLQNVIDPEIGLNIVDLGLIYQVDFDEAVKEVFVSMTLTTQFCPMGESIQKNRVSVKLRRILVPVSIRLERCYRSW